MKKNKGFTLAELLIVVAIIAVLVAIAMPVFANQLEKAKQATDLANIRSAYAEVLTAVNGEDQDISDNCLDKYGMCSLKSKPNVWTTKDFSEYDIVIELNSNAKKWNENKAYEPLKDLFTSDYDYSQSENVLGSRENGENYAVVGYIPAQNKIVLGYMASNPFE